MRGMEASGVTETIARIARRFVEIAPTGWARLIGNWEATGEPGSANLNYITTAVVDIGDRWGYGQLDFDEPLYDLVVELHGQMAEREDLWTVLDLEVDADGTFRTNFGYGQAKRTEGVMDEESYGRFQTYLDGWVTEHGPVPGGVAPATAVEPTASEPAASDAPAPREAAEPRRRGWFRRKG